MKSVGIKALKNKLSSYLKLVRGGEVVLVTDRDEVIAEIRRPRTLESKTLSPAERLIEDLAARGLLSPPTSVTPFPATRADLPKIKLGVDALSLLDESRQDRS